MGLTQADLLTRLRARINEVSESNWLDARLKEILDESSVQLCEDTLCLSAERTFSVTAYQPDFPLPTNFLGINVMQYQEGMPLDAIDYDEWRELYSNAIRRTGRPRYCMVNFDVLEGTGGIGNFRIDPVPSSSANTTTLNGAIISTSATSITVTSTASFKEQGTVIIDSEVIRYRNISSTQLLVCTRGAEGTTAATHLTGATVTERDIRVRYFTYPAAMSGSQDTQIPTRWIQPLIDLSAANALLQDQQFEKAKIYMAMYDGLRMDTKRNARRQFPRRTQYIREPYHLRRKATMNPLFRI